MKNNKLNKILDKIIGFFNNEIVVAIINITLLVSTVVLGGNTLSNLYYAQTSDSFIRLIIASATYYSVVTDLIENSVNSIIEAVDYISSIIMNKKGCVA